MRTRTLCTIAGTIVFALLPVVCLADPLPGEILKFSQRPMDNTPITNTAGQTERYWGHDELSTAYTAPGHIGGVYQGRFMADDFADKFDAPIVHVKWWGSYLNNVVNPNFPVNKFLIAIEEDVPAGPNNPFSRPGFPLVRAEVTRGPLAPGSGTFTEKPISGGGPPLNETLYEYNAELHDYNHFHQHPDTVYWLKIVALVDVPGGATFDPLQPPANMTRWGWHNRDYTIMDPLASTAPAVVPGEHIDGFLGPVPGGTPIWHFQDNAVTGTIFAEPGGAGPLLRQEQFQPTRYIGGVDGPAAIGDFSKDLAFELYTVPEPGVFGVIGLALMTLTLRSRR